MNTSRVELLLRRRDSLNRLLMWEDRHRGDNQKTDSILAELHFIDQELERRGVKTVSSKEEELTTPFWLRLLGALGVTAVIGYFVYLPFDIANGWGQGWIILGWAGLFILAVIALLILSAVWYWTYEGLPRVRFARRQQKD